MSEDRDLSDPVFRSAAGAACLIQYREDWEARAEVDVWGWNCFDHSPGVQAIARAIDRHESRVFDNIFHRSHE